MTSRPAIGALLPRNFASGVFAAGMLIVSASASAASNLLGAQGLGFISPQQSATWTAQTKAAAGSIVNIQPFREAEALRAYRSASDANLVASTIPMTQDQRAALTARVATLIRKNAKALTLAPVGEAKALIWSSLSARHEDDGSAILEVMVVVSDYAEADAKTRAGIPVIPALAKAVIWCSSARKMLAWDAVADGDAVSFAKVQPEVDRLYEAATQNLLLAL